VGPKPASLSFEQAAALPLAGVSAVQAVLETLNLQPGQKILIQGGGGAIGSIAIQLAKHLGAYVAATTSAKHADYVTSLGADEVIDYAAQQFQDVLSDYDAVFDTVGGDVYTNSFQVLKPGGAIVSMNARPDEALMAQYHVTATGIYTQVTPERLAKLTELATSGIIALRIDKTFPLEEAGAALGYLQSGSHQGKVVIKVRD
jgi:NADPH:quinone reductase-like Zn-dependent oxidoreductase